jgi:HTH-type transcriptional regulator/antitoxin HigA
MAKTIKARVPDDYLSLVKQFPLRPLRSVSDYNNAAKMLDTLVGRPDLSKGQQDYLDALTRFVEYYDQKHYPPKVRSTPIELLKAMMEHRGMNVTALGALFGSKGVASEVLNGKRELNLNQIYKLAGHFNVEPGVFLKQ